GPAGAGDRGGRPVLRGTTEQNVDGPDLLVRAAVDRRRLGRGVRRGRTGHAAQRGPRPGFPGAAGDPDRLLLRGRGRLPAAAPEIVAAERGTDQRLQPGLAGAG